MNFDFKTHCERPGCTDSATKTYSGTHDNTVRMCARHYWELVTDDSVTESSPGLGTSDLTGPLASSLTSPDESIFTVEEDCVTCKPPFNSRPRTRPRTRGGEL